MIQRNGSTLVELVLSMSAGSAVMLLAIGLVHQTMTLTEKSRQRADNHRALDQLAQNFRRDVHMATEFEVTSDDKLLIKNPDGSHVTYSSQNHTVVRQRKYESLGNENDRFILGVGSTASFQRMSSPNRVSLIVYSETELKGIPRRVELNIESIVGRLRLLERGEGASE